STPRSSRTPSRRSRPGSPRSATALAERAGHDTRRSAKALAERDGHDTKEREALAERNMMKTLIAFLIGLVLATSALAQQRTDATLRVTVVDPSGAVIVGARVVVRLAGELPLAQESPLRVGEPALAHGGPGEIET